VEAIVVGVVDVVDVKHVTVVGISLVGMRTNHHLGGSPVVPEMKQYYLHKQNKRQLLIF
jgi:hypothetical protein